MTFWGWRLRGRHVGSVADVLEPKEPIRITNVALAKLEDSSTKLKVFIRVDEKDILICTLDNETPSQKVDIMFDADDQVSFRVSGLGLIHLIGVVEPRDPDSGSSSEGEEGVEEEAVVEETPLGNRREKGSSRLARLARFRQERRN